MFQSRWLNALDKFNKIFQITEKHKHKGEIFIDLWEEKLLTLRT